MSPFTMQPFPLLESWDTAFEFIRGRSKHCNTLWQIVIYFTSTFNLIGWWFTIGRSLCKWGLGTGPSLYWNWKQSWRKKSGKYLPLCIQKRYFIDVDFMQDGKTPFLYACIKGNMNIVKLLMRKEAKVSVRDHARRYCLRIVLLD